MLKLVKPQAFVVTPRIIKHHLQSFVSRDGYVQDVDSRKFRLRVYNELGEVTLAVVVILDGSKSSRGIHLHSLENEEQLSDALSDAIYSVERDGFTSIIIHNS